jgi:iron(II)-dependent oxidoreductase
MQRHNGNTILALTLLFCVVNAVLGWWIPDVWLTAASMVGMCYVLLRISYKRTISARSGGRRPANASGPTVRKRAVAEKTTDPNDTAGLIEQMLEQGRFALLLRSRVVANMTQEQRRQAMGMLENTMSLVPDGEVVLGKNNDALDKGEPDNQGIAGSSRTVQVERLFLDRNQVTNEQYYEFVAASGYQQMALWDKSVLPAVLDLLDCSGMPGPRYWKDGCYEPGEENLPVVGVCWHEAAAYARWVGKRLPSDAEWVKAGCWPVPLSATSCAQRKFPWGNTMDRSRANLWGSGPEKIVPVDQFPLGVSVGGVYQLIGNVWEWTCGEFQSGTFHCGEHTVGELVLPTPMKSIRGGAFDTYFDNQATCQFQSGENPLHRKHNIGFRCAVAVRDLALSNPDRGPKTASEVPGQATAAANPTAAACTQHDGQPETGTGQAPTAEEMPV